MEYKSQQLEKELYYYKKSSRDLKKKLREYIAGTQSESGPVGSSVGSEVDAGKELTANVLRIKVNIFMLDCSRSRSLQLVSFECSKSEISRQ